ncbi:hypothetical protein N657DRAFT_360531 [Parathielavia appendiculata]|uniref:Uncharacterized protein n=1 Tax=Parathielavia appendiculata TaxID=2587402 RepID=A0AAN6Z5S6_9PEZI|nr:hypothetical protein N657DRAFT_360531 [Parathielavia appendiculata]
MVERSTENVVGFGQNEHRICVTTRIQTRFCLSPSTMADHHNGACQTGCGYVDALRTHLAPSTAGHLRLRSSPSSPCPEGNTRSTRIGSDSSRKLQNCEAPMIVVGGQRLDPEPFLASGSRHAPVHPVPCLDCVPNLLLLVSQSGNFHHSQVSANPRETAAVKRRQHSPLWWRPDGSLWDGKVRSTVRSRWGSFFGVVLAAVCFLRPHWDGLRETLGILSASNHWVSIAAKPQCRCSEMIAEEDARSFPQ